MGGGYGDGKGLKGKMCSAWGVELALICVNPHNRLMKVDVLEIGHSLGGGLWGRMCFAWE